MLHVYMPKEDILALNVTQEYTHTQLSLFG